jgi:hypothetical protein
MVIHYPAVNPTEDDEWLDVAIPETFETHIKGDTLVTQPVDFAE